MGWREECEACGVAVAGRGAVTVDSGVEVAGVAEARRVKDPAGLGRVGDGFDASLGGGLLAAGAESEDAGVRSLRHSRGTIVPSESHRAHY